MPTRANCTVVYSVAVDVAKNETRVWEVRFVYPVALEDQPFARAHDNAEPWGTSRATGERCHAICGPPSREALGNRARRRALGIRQSDAALAKSLFS